jgi:hypothetical protein
MSVALTKIIVILRTLHKVKMYKVMQKDNLYIKLRKF